MSEIKVGDLVMVVQPTPCCGNARYIGLIYTVIGVSMGARCGFCGTRYEPTPAIQCDDGDWIQRNRVKRIDPPSDEMKKETQRELETS